MILVSLKIGPDPPSAVSEEILRSLSRVEVTQGNSAPRGFQLAFEAKRYDRSYKANQNDESRTEWPLLEDDTLKPFNRVQVTVEVDETETVLIDGYITRQEISFDTAESSNDSALVITGEDVSVKMDLFEVSAEYEQLKTSEIVSQILGKYSSLGITASVTAPQGEAAPTAYIPQQNCTDRLYVQMLAAQNGYEFYVAPGSSAGQNTAYWGPPAANMSPQPTPQTALVAHMGYRTNVKSLDLIYDALTPALSYAQVVDLTQYPAVASPVAIGSATQQPSLSTSGAIPGTPAGSGLASAPTSYASSLSDLAVRGRISNYPGYPLADATQFAQAKTNLSVTDMVRIEGELDAEDYGSVLVSPGLVDVLGIGTKYGGTFTVKEVHHTLEYSDDWSYHQKFVLTRGGLGYKSPPAPQSSSN